jgi:translocation and assembly module TamB
MNWKKIVAWVGGGIGVSILLIVCAAYLVQRNTFLHRYLLGKMIQAAEKSSGAEIEIHNYAIRWVPLHVTLEGVTVRDTEKNSRPFASLPRIEIGISWRALRHKSVDLTELILDQPIINVITDQSGRSNLPMPPAASGSSTSKLQVSIEHAAVRNGELRYNDAPRKIDADLVDFHADVSHSAGTDRYTGNLGYSRGQIEVDGYAPVHHGTEVSFTATNAGITFDRIHLSTARSQFNAKGVVRGYSSPVVEGQYEAALSTADLREQLQSLPLSGGDIDLAGSVSYRAVAGPALNSLKLSGHVASRTLTASVSGTEMNFQSLAGTYALEEGTLHVTGLQTETMGGILRAEFTGERLAGTPRYQLSLTADSISLERVQQTAREAAFPLRGTAQLRANAHWTSTVATMVARADARISASLNEPNSKGSQTNAAGSKQATSLPVNGDLHVTYDAPHATLTVANSSFSSRDTSIIADGTVSDHSVLSLRARTSDLREVELLLNSVRNIPSAAAGVSPSSPKPLELRGKASVQAEIRGRIQDPRISGHVQADDLEIHKANWPHVESNFEATSASASLQNGQAQISNQGRLNFALSTSLQHWSYNANNPLTAQIQASQVPLADVEELAGSSVPVSGMLSASLSVHGTLDDPAGEGFIQLRDASLWGEPVRSVSAQIHGANKSVFANFNIAAAAGNITGNGEFGAGDRHYQISIRHTVLNLAQIHTLSSRGYTMTGTLGMEIQGQGTLKSPELQAALTGEQLALQGTPLGSLDAQLHVANERANFALTSNMAGGQIHANGDAGLAAPYMVHGGFEIRSLQFGPLLAAYLPGVRRQLQGNAEVSGQIDGPLANPGQVKASVELSALNLAYQDLGLASVGAVRLNYANNVITISQAELKGTDTDFKFGGTLPLSGAAPLQISTNGSIDLRLLTILGSNTQSSGTVKIDVTAKGAVKQPQLGGSIEIVKASFTNDVVPVGVDNLNARIAIANSRLNIETLSGQMSGGSFSVSGFAGYSPPTFSLQVNGKSIRVRYPEGTRAQLDTNLTLMGTPASSTLNGRVTIDGLSFTPDFDLANFLGQFTSSTPSVPSKWEQNTRLDVAVASSQELALSSSKLSLQGSADLRVAGTLANPVVLGRTVLNGGEIFFMGNRYQVQSGTVVFANPVRTEPTLNLYVTTQVQDYNITLNFLGPLDRLRTNYTSDPALPPVDIIHLLAFGKTTAQSAATATPAALGAESAIANGLTSQVSSRLEKLAGISQLQIDPSLGGDNSNPGARVAVQQRLTSTILFTFATDLTNTQNGTVQLKYQTRGRLSLSLTRDEYGSYAIEAKIRKRF